MLAVEAVCGMASISYYDMMECRLSSRVFSSLNGWVGLVLGGDGVNVFYAYIWYECCI